jgi:hypothetical protein
MTTAPPVPNTVATRFDAVATPTRPQTGSGEGSRRWSERQKLFRQQLVVVAVFLVALIITLLVLGQQWLNSGSAHRATSAPSASTTLTGEPI